MKRVLFAIAIILLLIPTSWAESSPPPPEMPGEDGQADELERIREALKEAVADQADENLAFLVNRIEAFEIKISSQEHFAVLYLAMVDPETGGPRTSEPGLAFAVRDSSGDWDVTLPGVGKWAELLETAPSDLLDAEHKAAWREINQTAEGAAPEAAIGGYRLPWKYGVTRFLSQSTEHDRYDPSDKAHYAFDFYDPDASEKMWDIYAAKGGTVWMMKEDVPTCYEPTCSGTQPLGNYIVLKDTSTVPTTYQLYLHLKQYSIPDYLSVGSHVEQGVLIGVVDNTGQSWGSHLHFMVHTTYNSYWGTSVDITFDDVSVNGGRPRRHDGVYYFDFNYCDHPGDVCITSQASYVSGNDTYDDDTPPSGGLTAPADFSEVTSASVTLSGWAADAGSGIASARFIVNYDGEWREVGPVFTSSPFNYNWNLCSSNVPDGPVLAGLRVYDGAGNLLDTAGIRHFTKNYACPVSLPTPANNQVLVCAETGYRNCTGFLIGSYPSSVFFPGTLEDNDAASILVGSAVQATLYSEEGYAARGETFFGELGVIRGDPNLTDNLVGIDHVSSIKVAALYEPPLAPAAVVGGENPPLVEGDIAVLHWDNRGFAGEYQVVITSTEVITAEWQTETSLPLVGLTPGQYSWKVRARNDFGMTGFSSTNPFTVTEFSGTLPGGVAPYDDPMDGSTDEYWIASGDWRIPAGEGFWRFQDPSGGYSGWGDLTSRPIHIPSSGYFLYFDSHFQTETRGPHWDRRWVQISAEGEPFENVLQIYDDQPNTWGRSYTIDLSAYSGQDIRVRFHFETLDEIANYVSYTGWSIDNFSINNTPPASYSDPAGNSAATALVLTPGVDVEENICPAGDQDYFRFSGTAGQHIAAIVEAQSAGSELDGVLYLLDADGQNIWFENDDLTPGVLLDPHLGYQLPYSGDYYLRLVDWRHPAVGGEEYDYTLSLSVDNNRPSVELINLETGGYVNGGQASISADAADTGTGIREVRFYWHSPDYAAGEWNLLAADMDGSDGWSVTFDPSGYAQTRGYAAAAIAYDFAGNTSADTAWNLEIDVAPPVTALVNLPAVQDSTAFLLEMTGGDNLSGLAYFEIQSRTGGVWEPFYQGGMWRQWIIGEIGSSYEYRSRGVDRAGNMETFPNGVETGTTIPLDVCSAPDPYEADDTYLTASAIITGEMQAHNLCLTGPLGPLGDVDWLSLEVITGTHYTVQVLAAGDSTAVQMQLYIDPNGAPVQISESRIFGTGTSLDFVADGGRVYIRIAHTNPAVAGNGVAYLVTVMSGYQIILPAVIR